MGNPVMIYLKKIRTQIGTILVLLIAILGIIDITRVVAQEVSTDSGSRTITTYVLAKTNSLGGGSLRMQVQYIVLWRAGICQEEYQAKTVNISAYVTDYTVVGFEHNGSFIPASDIDNYNLAREIDIEKLPTGVMPVIQNHELGRTENALSGMPLAGLSRTPLCDATQIYHTNLTDGQDDYTVRIENSDEIFEADAVVRITWDLFNEITGRSTDEELRSGGAYDNNRNETSGTNFGEITDQNSSEIQRNRSNSSTSSSTQNNNGGQNSASFSSGESNSVNLESEEEYRSWQDSHQSEMMTLYEEIKQQSEMEAQVYEQKMQLMEQAVTNVAGMINQIQEHREAERIQNKYRHVQNDVSRAIENVSKQFIGEADAYKQAIREIDDFLDRHGKVMSHDQRESAADLINEMAEEINFLYEQRKHFLENYSPRSVKNIIEINVRGSNQDRYGDFIYEDRNGFDETVDGSDFDWTFERLLKNLDENSSSTTLSEEMAEIARVLDEDRPSIQREYSYYSRYIPNEERYLLDALKNTNDTEYELELIEAYEEHFTNGELTEEFERVKQQKEEVRKKRLALIEQAEFHESEAQRLENAFQPGSLFAITGAAAAVYGTYVGLVDDNVEHALISAGVWAVSLVAGIATTTHPDSHLEQAKKYREEANQLTFSINKLSIGKDKFALGFRIEF